MEQVYINISPAFFRQTSSTIIKMNKVIRRQAIKYNWKNFNYKGSHAFANFFSAC